MTRKEVHKLITELINYFETTKDHYDFPGYQKLLLHKLDGVVWPNHRDPHEEIMGWLELMAYCEMMSCIIYQGYCETTDEDLRKLLDLNQFIREQSELFLIKKSPKP